MNEDKFNDTYRIPSARLKYWDYGSHGLYFVTICTKDRNSYFGEISTVETQNIASLQQPENIVSLQQPGNIAPQQPENIAPLQPTIIGKIAKDYWLQIPIHFPFVELDEFVIMPNHIHGILFINKPSYTEWKPNTFGPQSKNLASIVRGYKAGVKAYATKNNIQFEWQSRYWDTIISNEKDLQAITQYIISNPSNWIRDRNNPSNLM